MKRTIVLWTLFGAALGGLTASRAQGPGAAFLSVFLVLYVGIGGPVLARILGHSLPRTLAVAGLLAVGLAIILFSGLFNFF